MANSSSSGNRISKSGHTLHQEVSIFTLKTFDDGNQAHDDCNINFATRLALNAQTEGEYELGLNKIHYYMSMQNVHTNLTNTTIRYHAGGVPFDITLTNGNYSLSSIQQELEKAFVQNGQSSNFILLNGNVATGLVEIRLKPTAKIDFSLAQNLGLAILLGFVTNPNLDNTAGLVNLYSVATVDPTLNWFYNPRGDQKKVKVESIHVNVNIVAGKCYHNRVQDLITTSNNGILYTFIPNSIANTLVEESASDIAFTPIKNSHDIISIRIHLTNQDSQDLKGCFTKPIIYVLKMRHKDS